MKRVLLLALATLLSIGFVSCQSEEENERDTLVVGMEAAYAPFNWTLYEGNQYEEAYPLEGTNNYVDGYDVQIAILIAQALDMDLIIKSVEWDGLIPSLNNTKEIDLIIAGMSPTASRAQTVNFTDEYYSSTHVIVLRADSPYVNATSINDFDGALMVGQLSTIYDDLIDQMPGINHEDPLADVPTIITGINSGIYDGTILELPVAMAATESNPNLTYLEFEQGQGFNVSYEDKAVSIALRQDDAELLSQINEILSNISNETRESLMLDAIERQP
ncbi:transporter substrate-binding domain-containing protein [Hujiaoplasma nucleasis]|uniref:Transporter substrate-binding domain-containing protein n=1 Tax=Hujiaoplasma nucleasis TaxID=2725268 RepID=A0A7L6N359_9MOLU|nr:transporter substrate-binding domain-containing protein [Hujiaoplasma nucleasis]QLY39892.1 transporter substrate-binding domain-containing protein [Hujiaoplasma nucleasis]